MADKHLERLKQFETTKRPTMVGRVIAGLMFGVVAFEAQGYYERQRGDKVTAEAEAEAEGSSERLTSLQREALYGKQVLFVCVIPGPDGQLRQVELNIGGPETPIEAAKILEPDFDEVQDDEEPDFEEAWQLLALGIEEYNELAQGPDAQLSRTDPLGVAFEESIVPTPTMLWGIKSMTVEVFKDQNNL